MTTSAALVEPSSRTGSQPGSPTDTDSSLVSDDALRTLSLTAQPFSTEVSDGDWFSDNTTREQLVDIKEALINGEDLLLITGESGSGKTVLLKQLSGSGGSRIQCFSVRGSQRFSTSNLFAGLLEAFKLKPPAELEDTLKDVIPCLQALAERNMLGVIVLDDADLVSDQELSLLLGSLQYLNGGEDSLLRVLLAANPEFEGRIPSLLATTSELPYATLAMEPFDIGRSAAYLEHRLNKVGTFSELPFSEQQLLSICQSANGLPSGLNALAAAELNAFHQAVTSSAATGHDQGANRTGGAANQSQLEQANGLAATSPELLQKQPLRMVLGLAAAAMLATAAWLFVNPGVPNEDGDGFAVVSKNPVKPISTNEKKPEQIALVQEPTATANAVANNSGSTSAQTATETTTENNPEPSDSSAAATGNSTQTESADQAGATAQANTQAPTQNSTQDAVQTASQASATTDQNGVVTPLGTAKPTPNTPNGESESVAEAAETPPTAESTSTSTASVTQADPAPKAAEPEAAAAKETAATDTSAKSTGNELPLESANWVLVQDRELYTVQMSASDQRKDVEEFLKRSKLDTPNSIFSFKRGNNTWYALVHGLYPTITEARNAIESMPKSAKANQPWIRAISQIQDSVKSN